MLHPLLAPAAFIALLALGLLIGQHTLARTRLPVLAFLALLMLGLAGGAQAPGLNLDVGLLLAGLLTAGVALLTLRLQTQALALLCGTVAVATGLGLADMAAGETQGRWVVIAGTWLGAGLFALGVAAVVELAVRPWQRLAVRVVASWLAASALLVLGLQWAGPLPQRSPRPAAGAPTGAATATAAATSANAGAGAGAGAGASASASAGGGAGASSGSSPAAGPGSSTLTGTSAPSR